jgi:hypothetical protein
MIRRLLCWFGLHRHSLPKDLDARNIVRTCGDRGYTQIIDTFRGSVLAEGYPAPKAPK